MDSQTTTPTDTTQPTSGLRILVVDDSKMTRAMIRRSIMLSGVEAEIDEACDGLEALDRLRENSGYGVCFLDLNMPRLGGVEVAKAVCGDEAMNTRIVIVSSEAMAKRIDDLREAGVAGYIRKPFKPEAIRDVLTRIAA
ncbi:MAG: response regulator [Planctomycetota bacterium]